MSDWEKILETGLTAINSAQTSQQLDAVRVQFVGKKGLITCALKELGQLPADQRKEAGQEINETKQQIFATIQSKKEAIIETELNAKLMAESIDVTLPGRQSHASGLHPVTRTMQRIVELFEQVGFSVVTGPEIEGR